MADRRIEGTVEKLISGGDGLVRKDGAVFFIPGVLSGEKVLFDVAERKKGWARGRLTDILEASPGRVEPFCPLFGRCGGCRWQYMNYAEQLESKAAIVREALVRQGGLENAEIPDFWVIPSTPASYRSRIRPLILPDGTASFRQLSSDRTVRIPHCPVAVPGVNRFLMKPSESLRAGAEPIVFGDDEDFWAEGIDSEAAAVVEGKTFRFPPGVFFQSNLGPLPELLRFALDGAGCGRAEGRSAGCGTGSDAGASADSVSGAVPEGTGGFETGGGKTPCVQGDVALDLYGGVGLFGAFLADRFRTVIGVDRDGNAGAAWKRHVGPKGEFHKSTLEEWAASRERPVPDFIIVDPPRTGLSPPVRRALAELGAPEITYVSCDPITQSRDIKDLIASGYVLSKFALVDLYPQTPHVETVARLYFGGKKRL